MDKHHEIGKLSFENNHLRLEIDGTEYAFNLQDVSPRLLAASAQERTRYEISPSGYGIHWPLIDEDLSIDGLLDVQHRPPESDRYAPRGKKTAST